MSHDSIEFINTLPHPLKLYRLDYKEFEVPEEAVLAIWPKSDAPLRLAEHDEQVTKPWLTTEAIGAAGFFDKLWDQGNYTARVPVVQRRWSLSDFPECKEGVMYIVSLPVLMASDRADFVAPDTGPGKYGAVRDAEGQILGCLRFVTRFDMLARLLPGVSWPSEEWEAAQEK